MKLQTGFINEMRLVVMQMIAGFMGKEQVQGTGVS
jgi:hypothetical protein